MCRPTSTCAHDGVSSSGQWERVQDERGRHDEGRRSCVIRGVAGRVNAQRVSSRTEPAGVGRRCGSRMG